MITNKHIKQSPDNVPQLIKNDPYLKSYKDTIIGRQQYIIKKEKQLLKRYKSLSNFANGHLYYGLHRKKKSWIFREWAPNATQIFLIGSFSNWQEQPDLQLKRINEQGTWEIELPLNTLKHLDYYKLKVYWPNGGGDRIPSYAKYVVQDPTTKLFCARVWQPTTRSYKFKHPVPTQEIKSPIIYETHIGMAQEEPKVGSYNEFRIKILPKIAEAGYNTLQIMGIGEHPFYGSFGYQVSNFFAPSSRFGTPDELKKLIDEAHRLGLYVIMDLVHSHSVKNEEEGIANFDGTVYQYFHEGDRGLHSAWDTLCFNYQNPGVLHYLLSNCKYWLEEFKLDGYRFDGVTSMLYHHHGLSKNFTHYDEYFNNDTDQDALAYLALANKLIHQVNPAAITIAEDMSGMPGLAVPLEHGGCGFDYKLGMGLPDFWIKIIKEQRDEQWSMDSIWYELTNRRHDEKVISYCESHDQALVGDKTIIFRLMDKDIYYHMQTNDRNIIIDRGIALHKMIRLITLTTARGGYLNFMGNEFGHPEWIDFPRQGNNWSYHYARRQWHLVNDPDLCYQYLAKFDQAMIQLVKDNNLLLMGDPALTWTHYNDHVLGFSRGKFLFIFNFDPTRSYTDYSIPTPAGTYNIILNTDDPLYGGLNRIDTKMNYITFKPGHDKNQNRLSLYLPARTALVLQKHE